MKILLCNYDNGSRMPVLPQNLFHLQSILRAHGHDVTIEDFNVTKQPYWSVPYEEFDIVGLGFISGYWPHKEAIKFSKAINEQNCRHKFKFIIGGHGPSAAPEYYLKKLRADAVFVGSADYSLPAWLETPMPHKSIVKNPFVIDLVSNKKYIYDTSISQYYGSESVNFGLYKRIRFPTTRDDQFAIQILSARGCPYSCSFCYRPDPSYSLIPLNKLYDDIKAYVLFNGIRHFQFSDELLMGTQQRCVDICDMLEELQAKIGIDLKFDCNGRLNIASKYPTLIKRMKKVGFEYINYGCESMSDEVLRNINKKQTVAEIRAGVRNTVDAGIVPGLNFMWGNPGDNYQSLLDAAQFICEWSDGMELRTIRPVTPYPGTELFKRFNITVEGFYESHLNSDLLSWSLMKGITSLDANHELFEVNRWLIHDHLAKRKDRMTADADLFYHGDIDPAEFRGFREV